MTTSTLDHSLLEAALEGLEHRRQRIVAQIAEIRAQLGTAAKPSPTHAVVETAKSARKLSAAGRKRIADAARKRWAAHRAQRAKEAAAKQASKSAKPAKKTKTVRKPVKKAAKRRAPAQEVVALAQAAEAGAES